MRPTTLDRELARLAPAPDHDAVARAHAHVMAAVGAVPPPQAGPTTTRPPNPRRRVALRLGLAAALAAASVAGVTLWPHAQVGGVSSAYAAWRTVPQPVEPGDLAAQGRACLDAVRRTGGDPQALRADELAPALAERRGPWTMTLLVAGERGSHLEAAVTCLGNTDPSLPVEWGGYAGPAAGVPARDEIAWIGAGGHGHWFDVSGYVGDDVTHVAVTLSDGTVVEASVADGYFLAWWPRETAEVPEPFTLTWTVADGTGGGPFTWTAP